jgi:hypothetical protein
MPSLCLSTDCRTWLSLIARMERPGYLASSCLWLLPIDCENTGSYRLSLYKPLPAGFDIPHLLPTRSEIGPGERSGYEKCVHGTS